MLDGQFSHTSELMADINMNREAKYGTYMNEAKRHNGRMKWLVLVSPSKAMKPCLQITCK